jgi:thiaminase
MLEWAAAVTLEELLENSKKILTIYAEHLFLQILNKGALP